MLLPSLSMVWMVPDHWSNDAMVSMDRCGLLDGLLRQAEHVVDGINNQKQGMVRRAVRKMKDEAQACVALGGGVFEGRKL